MFRPQRIASEEHFPRLLQTHCIRYPSESPEHVRVCNGVCSSTETGHERKGKLSCRNDIITFNRMSKLNVWLQSHLQALSSLILCGLPSLHTGLRIPLSSLRSFQPLQQRRLLCNLGRHGSLRFSQLPAGCCQRLCDFAGPQALFDLQQKPRKKLEMKSNVEPLVISVSTDLASLRVPATHHRELASLRAERCSKSIEFPFFKFASALGVGESSSKTILLPSCPGTQRSTRRTI